MYRLHMLQGMFDGVWSDNTNTVAGVKTFGRILLDALSVLLNIFQRRLSKPQKIFNAPPHPTGHK